eukprot:8584320-Pyramimonas_sp.AAC.1
MLSCLILIKRLTDANVVADVYAKRAVQLHESAPHELDEQLDTGLRIANGFVSLAAAVLPLLDREERRARLTVARRAAHVQRTRWHDWRRTVI